MRHEKRKKQLKTISLDSEILRKIEEYAKAENRSVSNFIETALAQHVNEREAGGRIWRKKDKNAQ